MLDIVITFLSSLLYELPDADSPDAHEIKLRYNLIVLATIVYVCARALSGLWWRYCTNEKKKTTEAFQEELATALAEELQKNPAKLLVIAESAASEVLRRQQAQTRENN